MRTRTRRMEVPLRRTTPALHAPIYTSLPARSRDAPQKREGGMAHGSGLPLHPAQLAIDLHAPARVSPQHGRSGACACSDLH
jgi:hypothetical protein